MATKNCSLSGDSKKRKLFIFARRRRKLDRLRSKRSLQSVSVPQQKFSGLKCYLGKWLNFCCCFFLVTHARSSELCAPRKLGGYYSYSYWFMALFQKSLQCYGTPCIHHSAMGHPVYICTTDAAVWKTSSSFSYSAPLPPSTQAASFRFVSFLASSISPFFIAREKNPKRSSCLLQGLSKSPMQIQGDMIFWDILTIFNVNFVIHWQNWRFPMTKYDIMNWV